MMLFPLVVSGSLSDTMSPSNGCFVANEAVHCVNGGPILLSMAPAVTYNFLTSLEMLPKNNEFTWIV